ncbi:hypothetical protein CGCSCA4_v007641 [Colletotrichum siamense]|uniref:Uncharacterized protein n=1 Tax=Colletotrichum siamense TaxID=690259 RepID=A0A9P5K3I0_COLSI|nr:uncharacterized protein CGCS363_v013634 [Colletotrichum siamense]KAF4844074.1 hypothetical protein CGCSCA4_v007641 [Colletotrichum siamense]KAF4857823.1 hypothetical protein CGCSCA2_v007988 [Colletotrichum siamense]KAF5487229.1 hypothetical protein CGCS363_v013634 [Colletotrichum siamense]
MPGSLLRIEMRAGAFLDSFSVAERSVLKWLVTQKSVTKCDVWCWQWWFWGLVSLLWLVPAAQTMGIHGGIGTREGVQVQNASCSGRTPARPH